MRQMRLRSFAGNPFLSVSALSMLGSCETMFARSLFGYAPVTQAMRYGAQKHRELEEAMPFVDMKEAIARIASGEACAFREVHVVDYVNRMRGRIDHLEFTGMRIGEKNEALIIDDKYPAQSYPRLPSRYQIQLAAYSAAIHHSDEFAPLCTVTGARLLCRDSMHAVRQAFSVGQEDLQQWEGRIPLLAQAAWAIAKRERIARHVRYDISGDEWLRCAC